MGSREVRITRLATAIVLVASGIWASAASAEPLSMTFTEARANVGKQLSDADLFAAPDSAPFAAQIDPVTGSITSGVLGVPDFETHITEPVATDVTVDFNIGQITGSFDRATGALSLIGEAGGTLTASGNPTYEGEQCTVLAEPSPITLTTSGSSGGTTNPRSGTPFATGLAGSGAIAGEWQNMSAEPVEPGVAKNESFCENVENQIGGPGGIWLEQEDRTAPAPPQLTSTDPASPSSNGTPRIRGTAEPGSTVRIYPYPACNIGMGTGLAPGMPRASGGTGSAAELASPGIAIYVPEGTSATFSATATDAAGNTSACSSSIAYTHLHFDPPAPPSARCIVPKLAGKTPAQARAALKAAHCKLAKVRKPKRRKGQQRRPLVVRSSSPRAGAEPADGTVDVRLGPKPRRAHR